MTPEELKLDFISYSLDLTSRKGTWKYFGLSSFFVLGIYGIANFVGLPVYAKVIAVSWAAVLSVVVFSTVFGRRDFQIAACGMSSMLLAVALIVAGISMISTSGVKVSGIFLIQLACYALAFLFNLVNMRRLILKGYYVRLRKNSQRFRSKYGFLLNLSPLAFPVVSILVTRFVLRRIDAPYDAMMFFGMSVMFIMAILLCLDSHRFLCFYYMRKYKVK
jgi:hypothetical protein